MLPCRRLAHSRSAISSLSHPSCSGDRSFYAYSFALFVRRTTKLMKRNGNWGLAALYIDGLMAHADKNRGKLEAELDECRANGLRNQPGLVPEEIMRTGRNIKMPLRQAAHYLEQAREMSAETRDAEGLANDSGCLGLVYHLLGVSQKALQYAQEGLSAATAALAVEEVFF